MVSSAAQLLVVLPAAEPAHTGSPGVGGNQSAEKSGDTHRYAMDSCPVMVAGPSYSTGAKVGPDIVTNAATPPVRSDITA